MANGVVAVHAQKLATDTEAHVGPSMSFANANYTDVIATSIESRSPEIADNVSKNNAVLMQLKMKDRIRTFTGGHKIIEPISQAENGNGQFFSGYDILPIAAQDVISAAEYAIKQYAVAITMSGLEKIQNSGKEGILDLLAARVQVAEATMANDLSQGIYSDGTPSGGKSITGLDAAVPQDPTTGIYGGINRGTTPNNVFWRSQIYDPASTPTTSTIQGYMNTLWAMCQRGADRPDLILSGGTIWATYLASLQAMQRFTGTDTGKLGFPSVKYMDADVVLDGGIGGFATATDMYFLNTDYIFWRPHVDTNMVPLGPKERVAVNMDAIVQVLGFAGNLTSSGPQFSGRLKGD